MYNGCTNVRLEWSWAVPARFADRFSNTSGPLTVRAVLNKMP